MYCTQCGKLQKEGSSYCTKCGKSLGSASHTEPKRHAQPQETMSPSPAHNSSQTVKQNGKKSPLPKIIISIAVLGGILYGGHTTVASMLPADEQLEEWEVAVLSEDKESLATLIEAHDEIDEISEEQVEGFLGYIRAKGDDSMFDDLYSAIENEKRVHRVADRNGNDILELQKGDKRFGLYEYYEIQPVLFSADIHSSFEDVVLTVNETQYDLESENEQVNLDQLLPGDTEVEVVYANNEDVRDEDILSFTDARDNQLDHQLHLDWGYIDINTDHPEAELLLDDEPSGVSMGDADELGPFVLGEQIKLEARMEVEGEELYTGVTDYVVGELAPTLNFNRNEIRALEESEEETAEEGTEEEADEQDIIEIENEETVAIEDDSAEGTLSAPSESEDIELFMQGFVVNSVNAMNAGDESYVLPYYDQDATGYAEFVDYLDYIIEEGITEEVMHVEKVDSYQEGNYHLVTLDEGYEIYYGNGREQYKRFETTYRVEESEEGYKIKQIEELIETEDETLSE